MTWTDMWPLLEEGGEYYAGSIWCDRFRWPDRSSSEFYIDDEPILVDLLNFHHLLFLSYEVWSKSFWSGIMMVLKIFLVLYFSIRISTEAKMPMDAIIRNGITPFLTRNNKYLWKQLWKCLKNSPYQWNNSVESCLYGSVWVLFNPDVRKKISIPSISPIPTETEILRITTIVLKSPRNVDRK